jgi:hypothetical protein
VDQTGDYAFEVPIVDPHEHPSMVGGNYPFTLDNGATTVLHLKNTTGKPKQAIVQLNFPDGTTYAPELYELQANETIVIDIQKLKDENKPDIHKNTFPKNQAHGQLIWLEVKPELALIGRAEELSQDGAVAHSFSCYSSCHCNWHVSDAGLDPDGGTWAEGWEGTVQPWVKYRYCGGSDYGPYGVYAYVSGSSGDENVAQYDGNELYCIGAGSTSVYASWDDIVASLYDYGDDTCTDITDTIVAGAQVTVCGQPASLRITDNIPRTYSGQHLYDDCGDGDQGAPNIWGHSRCIVFQLVDNCGNDLTSGDWTFHEARTIFTESPMGQNHDGSDRNSSDGRVEDLLEYATDQSPGIPSGMYKKIDQVISVTDNVTANLYSLDSEATRCQDFEANGVTSAAGACD